MAKSIVVLWLNAYDQNGFHYHSRIVMNIFFKHWKCSQLHTLSKNLPSTIDYEVTRHCLGETRKIHGLVVPPNLHGSTCIIPTWNGSIITSEPRNQCTCFDSSFLIIVGLQSVRALRILYILDWPMATRLIHDDRCLSLYFCYVIWLPDYPQLVSSCWPYQ